jgi:hypothetical protein
MIMNFKVWCKMNDKLIPDGEEEILRHLYACDADHDKAYVSMRYKFAYHDRTFPMDFTNDMKSLLNSGGIYLHGRDKCFRPIVILNLEKILEVKQSVADKSS